jgi:hypothetical protein
VLREKERLRRLVEDREPGRDADLDSEARQRVLTERVKRGNLGVGVAIRNEHVDPLLHLGRGLFVEREREDLGRTGPSCRDQVCDAARDHGGLAGAGAGHDEERPLVVLDRGPLL